MVRTKKDKKPKGDDAFKTRKQKVGKKKLEPATSTKAEVHARSIRIVKPKEYEVTTDVMRDVIAQQQLARTRGAADATNANQTEMQQNVVPGGTRRGASKTNMQANVVGVSLDSTFKPRRSLKENIVGALHYREMTRSSSLTALNQVVDRVGKVLVHLDEGVEETTTNSSGGAAHKKPVVATKGSAAGGIAVFSLSPMEHMQLMNIALAAVSGDTANDVREKALALFLKLLRLFPTMHVDATLHIVSYIRIALTHASMGVRRAGLKMLGEFIQAWPGAIRNAFCKEQHEAGSKTAAAVASMTAAAAAVASSNFMDVDRKDNEGGAAEVEEEDPLAPQTTARARTTMIEQIVDWATQLAVNAKVMHQHILLPPVALLLEECLPIDMSTSINKVLACGHFASNSQYTNLLIQQKKYGSGSAPQYGAIAGGQQEHHRRMYEGESRTVLEMIFARAAAATPSATADHYAATKNQTHAPTSSGAGMTSVGFISGSDPTVTPTTTSMGCGGILSPWFVQFYFNKFQSKLALSWKELMELQHKLFRDTTISMQRALMIARWFTCASIYLKRNNLLSRDQAKIMRELFVHRVPFTLKDLVLRDREDDSDEEKPEVAEEEEDKPAEVPTNITADIAESVGDEDDDKDSLDGASSTSSSSSGSVAEKFHATPEAVRAEEKIRQRKLTKLARRMGISVVDLGGKYIAPSTIAGAKNKRRLQQMVTSQSTSMNPATAKQIAAIEPMVGRRAGRGKVYNNLAGPEMFIVRGNTLTNEQQGGSAGKAGVSLSTSNNAAVGDKVKTTLSSLNGGDSLNMLAITDKAHRLHHRQLAEAICWCLVPIASASEGHFLHFFTRLVKHQSPSSGTHKSKRAARKAKKAVAAAAAAAEAAEDDEEENNSGDDEDEKAGDAEEEEQEEMKEIDDIRLQEYVIEGTGPKLQSSFEARDLIKGVLSHFLDNVAYERSVQHHLSAVTTALDSPSSLTGAVLPYMTKSASSANASLCTVHEAIASTISFFETAVGLFPQLQYHWAVIFEKSVVERVFYTVSTELLLQQRYHQLMGVMSGTAGNGPAVIEALALANSRRLETATRNLEGTLRLIGTFMNYSQRLCAVNSGPATPASLRATKAMRDVLSSILLTRLPRLLFASRAGFVAAGGDGSMVNASSPRSVLLEGNLTRLRGCIHNTLVAFLHAVRDRHVALANEGSYTTLMRALTPVCMGLTHPTTGERVEGPVAHCSDETRLVAEHLFFYLRQNQPNATTTNTSSAAGGIIACESDLWLLANFNTVSACC